MYLDNIIRLFKCKFHLEEETLEAIGKIGGEPFVTVRHGENCFPFGVKYNGKTRQFRVEK